MSENIANLNVSYEVVTSNESDENMDLESLRRDALAWTGNILQTCNTTYQCKFLANQYVRIFNKITDAT